MESGNGNNKMRQNVFIFYVEKKDKKNVFSGGGSLKILPRFS